MAANPPRTAMGTTGASQDSASAAAPGRKREVQRRATGALGEDDDVPALGEQPLGRPGRRTAPALDGDGAEHEGGAGGLPPRGEEVVGSRGRTTVRDRTCAAVP